METIHDGDEIEGSLGEAKIAEAVRKKISEMIDKTDFDLKELKVATEVLSILSEKFGISSALCERYFAPELFDYQKRFIESATRFSAMIGGVRSGKTYAGAVKGLKRALLLPCVGAVVAPTAAMARDVLVRQYAELAGGRIAKWNGSILEMTLLNGSRILFRSADNPERLMGLTLDWFHLDEAAQLPRRVWEVLVNRTISTGGPGFFTTTPRGRNWVYDIVESWKNDPDTTIVFARTSDNPLIDAGEIERARRQLDPKYFRQQFEASFEEDGLRVYEDFDPSEHVLEKSVDKIGDAPIFIGVDLGWTHPSALIWGQLSDNLEWTIIDELVAPHMRLEKIADAILGKPVNIGNRTFVARVPFNKIERVIFGLEGRQSRQEAGGESAISTLSTLGVNRVSVYRGDIVSGIHAVRAKLKSADGKILLKIDPRCKKLIEDFLAYQYPADETGKIMGEIPEKDDIHDHTMDAIRYMIAKITPIQTSGWKFWR